MWRACLWSTQDFCQSRADQKLVIRECSTTIRKKKAYSVESPLHFWMQTISQKCASVTRYIPGRLANAISCWSRVEPALLPTMHSKRKVQLFSSANLREYNKGHMPEGTAKSTKLISRVLLGSVSVKRVNSVAREEKQPWYTRLLKDFHI